MARKKHEFEETATEIQPDVPLAVRQSWMVNEPGSHRHGQNWRIIAFVEPAEEGGPSRVKYQFQIPLGPGKAASTHKGCPNCGYGQDRNALMTIPATRQTDERNETKVSTEEALRKEWREAGAVMVEKGLIDVELV